jgi:hypothetical protein
VVRIALFGSDAYRRLLAVIWHDGANVNLETESHLLKRAREGSAGKSVDGWQVPGLDCLR